MLWADEMSPALHVHIRKGFVREFAEPQISGVQRNLKRKSNIIRRHAVRTPKSSHELYY